MFSKKNDFVIIAKALRVDEYIQTRDALRRN